VAASDVRHDDVRPLDPEHAVGMLTGVRELPSSLGQGGEVLDEEDRQRATRPERRGPPAQLLAAGGAAPTAGRIAHVDAAAPHRLHVRVEIVALHAEVAQPTAGGQERPEPGAGLGRAAWRDAQQLEIVLLQEGDGVLGAAARVRPARMDVEADPAVRLDTVGEVRDADHHVIDPGEHGAAMVAPARAKPGSGSTDLR